MLGIDGKATISGDVCRVSVAGLGPRRRQSRSLKAVCSQVRALIKIRLTYHVVHGWKIPLLHPSFGTQVGNPMTHYSGPGL